MDYRMNLAVKAGDERVLTGYEQILKGSREEVNTDFVHWLLGMGFTEDELEGRILCDPVCDSTL